MWSSERLEAVLLGFWAAAEATSWGSRWGAEPLAAHLPFTTQLDFEPHHHIADLSACLITKRCRRTELEGWGRRLFVNECHLFMDQWMRFGDRDRRIVLCWPNSGGYFLRS